jgi:predicted lipoprotein with Yx(FWY)xxD motif
MFQPRRIPLLVIAAGMLLAACTGSGATAAPPSATAGTASAQPSAAGTAPAQPSASAAIGVATTSFGSVLVGPAGRTLYIHAGDGTNMSTCTGGCASAWPPLTVMSGQQPTAANPIKGGLGTFMRSDGSTEVSYKGLPLYYWQGDTKPGDVTGQGVDGFSVALVNPTSAAPSAPAPVTPGGYGY